MCFLFKGFYLFTCVLLHFFKGVIYVLLKVKSEFRSESCVKGMSGYPGLTVVGELGSDVAVSNWFLLLMFLNLSLTIWLSLVLSGLPVSDWSLSFL